LPFSDLLLMHAVEGVRHLAAIEAIGQRLVQVG
jgi:hypothetical protein